VTLEQYSVSVWNVDSLPDIFSVKIAMGMGMRKICLGMWWGMGMNVYPRVNL